MKDTKTKEEFIKLRAEGLSFDKISTHLGVSKPTLLKWEQELEKEIAEAKFIHYESLIEQFGMMKQKRLENYGKFLQKINNELENRPLGDVSTEKLLMMALSVSKRIKGEMERVEFRQGGIDIRNDLVQGKKFSLD